MVRRWQTAAIALGIATTACVDATVVSCGEQGSYLESAGVGFCVYPASRTVDTTGVRCATDACPATAPYRLFNGGSVICATRKTSTVELPSVVQETVSPFCGSCGSGGRYVETEGIAYCVYAPVDAGVPGMVGERVCPFFVPHPVHGQPGAVCASIADAPPP